MTKPTRAGLTSAIVQMEAALAMIPVWRAQARIAVALNPVMWLAVQGVSYSEYITKLDELEKTMKEGTAKLREELAALPPEPDPEGVRVNIKFGDGPKFSQEQILDLIKDINAAVADGAKLSIYPEPSSLEDAIKDFQYRGEGGGGGAGIPGPDSWANEARMPRPEDQPSLTVVPEFPDRSTYVPHDGKTNQHEADPLAIFEVTLRSPAEADPGVIANWIWDEGSDNPNDIVAYRITGRQRLPATPLIINETHWKAPNSCIARCKLRAECRRRPACDDAPGSL